MDMRDLHLTIGMSVLLVLILASWALVMIV